MQKLAHSIRERLDLMVLIFCLLFSYAVWSYGNSNDKTDHDLVQNTAHDVQVVMTEEAENIFAFIDGVRGLYMSSDVVSIEELSAYMSATSQNHLTDGLLRINYVARIPTAEVDDKSLIEEGHEDQFIVTQMVDKKGNIYDPQGFNLLSENSRKGAVERVLSGDKTVVVRVEKIEQVEGYDQEGFVFIVPVMKEGEIVGLIDAVVVARQFYETVSELIDQQWGYEWYQGDELVYKKDIESTAKSVTNVAIIPVGENDEWNIKIAKIKGPNVLWTVILGLGVLLSFLIYAVVYALNSANLRGEELAKAMTKDLLKYKLALDWANNHIVITDPDGKVLYANRAAEQLTGYTQTEILGSTPKLWGGLMDQDFYVRFWKQIKQDKKVFSGTFKNRRKNGDEYMAQATVSPILDESGEIVGFVGVEEDVTKERQILKQNQESLTKLEKFNELMVGREIKMVELKKELAKLKGDIK